MIKKLLFLILFPGLSAVVCTAQNLPSLLLDRNINATFSIIGYDPQAQEWGVAVATNNIYVGNSTCYVIPGVGAFSCIAETEPRYATEGFQLLNQGRSVKDAILLTRHDDPDSDTRQVSGIDAKGEVFAFTGSSLKYWKGSAGDLSGKSYVVMGNQLAPGVLHAMAAAFTDSGTLAERLLKSLIAGQHAGGQITGKQSAALLVKGTRNEWFNQIDLRVDHSRDPFGDLQRLLDYHYGRILLNQSNYALQHDNRPRAEALLQKAILQTRGWYGIYPKIAKTFLLLGQEQKAIALIRAAVTGEPQWKQNLSAFYCLYHDTSISVLYPVEKFTTADWNNAISMLIDLHRLPEAAALAKKTLVKYPSSSYTWYLEAKACLQLKDIQGARTANEKALQLDQENADAIRLEEQMR